MKLRTLLARALRELHDTSDTARIRGPHTSLTSTCDVP